MDIDWGHARDGLAEVLGATVDFRQIHDHVVFETDGEGRAARQWLIDSLPTVTVLSYGRSIELFKAVGDPDRVAQRYGLAERTGTHAIGHTRMATESAVTTKGSHPFSTGADTCLVHNGSLSNHNNLREVPRKQGRIVPNRQRFRSRGRLSGLASFAKATRSRTHSSVDLRISTDSSLSQSGYATASLFCSIPSHVSLRSSPRLMIGSPCHRNIGLSPSSPTLAMPRSGNPSLRRSTPGDTESDHYLRPACNRHEKYQSGAARRHQRQIHDFQPARSSRPGSRS